MRKYVKLAGKDKALPMNTGAEAVETALKLLVVGLMMLKVLSRTKLKLSPSMVIFMDVRWHQYHCLQKLSINEVMVHC